MVSDLLTSTSTYDSSSSITQPFTYPYSNSTTMMSPRTLELFTTTESATTDTFTVLRGLCVFPAYPVPRLVDTYTAPTCSPKCLPGLESCIKEGKQGDTVTTNCSPGFSGVQQYVCTWKRIHDKKHGYFLDWTSYGPGTCTLQSCPLYNSYPFCRDACLNSTHSAEGPCPDGEIGFTTWQCWDNSTSEWSYKPSYDFSTCEVAICPAENTTLSNVGGLTLRWDESLPGVWHQNCPEPYSGTVFYRCDENGYWLENGPDTRDCNKETHKLCPADCLTNFPGYCWNVSSPGFAVQPCPSGKLGTAQWLCGSEGHWATKLPDMSNCRSNVPYFNDAFEDLNADTMPPTDVIENLSQNLRNVTLVGGDINSVSNVSRLALQKQRATLNAPTDDVKNFTVALCNLTDFLLTDTQVWWSLPLENRRQELESVMANTADSADLISLYLVNETFQMDSFPNIALRTENRVDGYFYGQSYDFAYGGVEIQLPDNFEEYDKSNVTRLASYVLSSASLILSGDQNKNYYLELPLALLSTPVLGIALGAQPTVFQNGTFVALRFPKISGFSEYIADPMCVFFNWSTKRWSNDGCRMGDRSDHDNLFCECDHLTNFAILMDITGILIEKVWLDCVTIIGCSVSVISLLLSICIYYSLKARNMRYQINLNIFSNMLVAEILFLSGNSEIGNASFCAFIAAAMQYFFLAMFVWMSLGAFHLYEQITRVFDHSRKMLFFYMFGYGVPLAIVTLALAINQARDYGTESFCWFDTTASSGIIWSFAGPVAVTILWNVFVILLTVHRVLNARNLGAQKNPPSNGTWVIGSLSLSVLFGVTWIFGFFYVNERTIFMAYIFTIVNSFQGLFVFLFECVINPQVRNEWRPIFISFKERLTTPFRENLFDSSNWRFQNQKSFLDAFDNVVKLNKFKRHTSFQTVRRLGLRLRNMHIYFKWNSPRQLTETVSSESNTSS